MNRLRDLIALVKRTGSAPKDLPRPSFENETSPARLQLQMVMPRGKESQMPCSPIDDRFGDIRKLKENLEEILHPLAEISAQLSYARNRIADLEKSIEEARESVRAARQIAGQLKAETTNFGSEYAAAIESAERVRAELTDCSSLLQARQRLISERHSLEDVIGGQVATYQRQVIELRRRLAS